MAHHLSTEHPSRHNDDVPCLHSASTLPAFAALGDADVLGRHYARLYSAYRAAAAA